MLRRAKHSRRRFLATSLIPLAAAPLGLLACSNLQSGMKGSNEMQQFQMVVPLPVEAEMPSLEGATGWLNSEPALAEGLRGKVVLVEFWTYSCINWIRTLPYVRAWYEKYRDHGLVVIGVHTPEFPFERDIENVRQATNDFRIHYSIATDNSYAIWRAFRNNFWPALYFVDAAGRIRHHRFGENDYERSERVIQHLLREAGFGDVGNELVSVEGQGAEASADWGSLRSLETYIGYQRTGRFASPEGLLRDGSRSYSGPTRLGLNQWALAGDWTVEKQKAILDQAGGSITYRFHARDVHLVLSPAAPGETVRFCVLVDGQPPGAAHGADVDADGAGVVSEPRLYQLVRQPAPIVNREFEIQFLDPGVEAFVFTFG